MLKITIALLSVLVACSTAFKYKNCGSNQAIRVNQLSLSPSSIHFPGQLRISGSATINRPINGNLEVKMDLKKKFLFWIKVPCVKGIGSCTHRNICDKLKLISCPAGKQCRCPFSPGTINFDEVVNLPKIPTGLKILAKGSIKVKAMLRENGREIGCVEIETSIK
ncbi:ganglioside GM2 activator-like [Tubulanus polymorphus]|uniref:ganglioside GM2 activator-like n=1 Tax=Tubulanus polymorphus TaxID=672921 RepID=UPI003DA5E294